MAKKKQLTIEEKLQNALVPKEEQPYKIPSNWCWTYVSNIMNIVMGQSPKGVDTTQNILDVPLIGGASDMGDLYPIVNKYTRKPTKLSKKNDVILSIRATLGRPIFSDGVYCLGRGVAGVSSNYLSKEFIRYYYICFESILYSNATGTTFLQVTGSVLNKMLIPLPPLNEQQRIVNRIESLFTKLDRAKELIENTLAQFEQNKMAILHKAFTGELTAKWRKENNIDLSSWECTILKNIIDVRDGTHDSPIYVSSGYPLITSKNLKNNKVNFNNIKYITKEDYDNINKRSKVEINDVLFSMIGTIGNPVIIKEEPLFAIKNVALFKSSNYINMEFFRNYLETKYVLDKMKKEAKGTTQKFVSLNYLRNFPIKLPTIEEQQEIVNILDKLLAKYNKIKNLEQQLEKIELLKKAILAKAFRGELGTNNPDEESAEKLLAEILAEKEN